MSTHPRPKLSREAAERLLAARHANGSPGPRTPVGTEETAGVASLLAAAATSSGEREFSGETDAVAAFLSAHLAPASTPRRRQPMSATKLLAVKLVLAAVGVTASGGVALAASTGHMPAVLGGHSAASPAASAASSTSGASGTSPAHPSASPSPNLQGLCTAYTKGVAASSGKALDNPAFSALVTAAGGKSNVAAFCAALPAKTHPGNTPTAHSTGKPTDLPTAHATPSHPTGPAATPSTPAHPTGAPTTTPSGHPHS